MAKRLLGQSLKLLLEENRKWCHRLGADVLTLGSRQPLPTHKQRCCWMPAKGSNICNICAQEVNAEEQRTRNRWKSSCCCIHKGLKTRGIFACAHLGGPAGHTHKHIHPQINSRKEQRPERSHLLMARKRSPDALAAASVQPESYLFQND